MPDPWRPMRTADHDEPRVPLQPPSLRRRGSPLTVRLILDPEPGGKLHVTGSAAGFAERQRRAELRTGGSRLRCFFVGPGHGRADQVRAVALAQPVRRRGDQRGVVHDGSGIERLPGREAVVAQEFAGHPLLRAAADAESEVGGQGEEGLGEFVAGREPLVPGGDADSGGGGSGPVPGNSLRTLARLR